MCGAIVSGLHSPSVIRDAIVLEFTWLTNCREDAPPTNAHPKKQNMDSHEWH
jgi:hypothetical protein